MEMEETLLITRGEVASLLGLAVRPQALHL